MSQRCAGEFSGFSLIITGERLTIAQHVHEYVTQEYSRTCLISFESLPKDAHREGWGAPGTPVHPFVSKSLGRASGSVLLNGPRVFRSTGTERDGVCFRRALLDTVPDLGPSFCTYHIPSITVRFQRGRGALSPVFLNSRCSGPPFDPEFAASSAQ